MTLNEIVFDIINTMSHGRSTNNTYATNERLIKFWIKKYRALLIRRQEKEGLGGGSRLLEFEQELDDVKFIALPKDERGVFTDTLGSRPLLRTETAIPRFVRLSKKPAITYVGTRDRGINYPLVDRHRIQWDTRYNKYTNNKSKSVYWDNHIYITNPTDIPIYHIQRVNVDTPGNTIDIPRPPQLYMVHGIFEDPEAAWAYAGYLNSADQANYPVPLDFAQQLTQSIMNGEAKAILGAPNDISTNTLPDEVLQ